MQYYMIEWDHEEEDEPWKLYLELDSRGCPRRKVEVFRVGLYQSYDDLDEPPTDPRQAAGSEGNVTALNRVQFEDIWEQSRQMPDGFMGMFFLYGQYHLFGGRLLLGHGAAIPEPARRGECDGRLCQRRFRRKSQL